MSAQLSTKIDFWIKNNLNVLLIGRHGVGKTGMVKQAFERHNLNYRYFSASTMDPWVDFVGVPKEKTENPMPKDLEIIKELASLDIDIAIEWIIANWKISDYSAKRIVNHAINRNQGNTYLDLVRPETFATGDIEALFFDEYNRSPKKVRNAVMELIQFKSINGKKFPNLRFVWAAINPDDDPTATYDVEQLDPAQQDRFQIINAVEYKPDVTWFRNRYGNKYADSAIQWWEELPEDQKNHVSPRRLQYALDMYVSKGDVRDVLPVNVNASKLSSILNSGPITEKLEALYKSQNVAGATAFLANENNYTSAMKLITKSETLMSYFIPLIPKEKMSKEMAEDDKMCRYIIGNLDKFPIFKSACKEILEAKSNDRLCRKIKRALTENEELNDSFTKMKAPTISANASDEEIKNLMNSVNVSNSDGKRWLHTDANNSF